jgi:pyrroloquinoline-quinone synthase
MSFSQQLVTHLSDNHLLKHPFYQAWNDGSLPIDTIRAYAGQYFHHVRAFPRYLSATHSACEDVATRQLLLENLIDEERGEDNHPELWLRFAEALGLSREEVQGAELAPATRELIDTFVASARSSYEEGLGVLFAYEHQIPEIAQFKLEALRKHYGVASDRGVSFFEVHRKADVYHTQALSQAIDALPAPAQERARRAAYEASRKLWAFLDSFPMAKPALN